MKVGAGHAGDPEMTLGKPVASRTAPSATNFGSQLFVQGRGSRQYARKALAGHLIRQCSDYTSRRPQGQANLSRSSMYMWAFPDTGVPQCIRQYP